VQKILMARRNVSFKYPGREDFSLQNISFVIKQGQLCVIVGTNGSGKSTIIKLLLRFYDPTEGSVHINGLDIREMNTNDLRDAVSVLFQNFSLMHFSVSIFSHLFSLRLVADRHLSH
jgi:ABC-type multidrug transport system fused ATPase/permease subunit